MRPLAGNRPPVAPTPRHAQRVAGLGPRGSPPPLRRLRGPSPFLGHSPSRLTAPRDAGKALPLPSGFRYNPQSL
jgi:hypothetical protein